MAMENYPALSDFKPPLVKGTFYSEDVDEIVIMPFI